VIMAVLFVFAGLVILFNLIADILYGWLDLASPIASAGLSGSGAKTRLASPALETWRRFRRIGWRWGAGISR